tara:strand:- start:3996 stop:5693 length:1698 start_codon:yes stop_codon:yes gene_type:complete
MNPIGKANEITAPFGVLGCKQFREGIFSKHLPLCIALAHQYKREALKSSYIEANRQLLQCDQFLTIGSKAIGLSIYSDDDEVRAFAELKADAFRRKYVESFHRARVPGTKNVFAIKSCIKELAIYGLSFPCRNWRVANDDQIKQAAARVFDQQWWRRQIRQLQGVLLETMNRQLGLVNKEMGIYASNFLVQRYREAKRRNANLMSLVEMENDLGETATLQELNESSVSNPVNRRNEFMVRVVGFEEIAKECGDVGVFITLTAPSKYHAYLSNPCRRNTKFAGYSVKETQTYLNNVWKRSRASLSRLRIKPYGFRIVEPHHDGTPHWHMLFFVKPHQIEALTSTLSRYALQEDGDEKGASEHRLKVEEIDPSKGSAAGYIAKYVSKNIDGFGVPFDNYGNDAASSAERIVAWASTHGIRQFQQIGGVSVTVYRELRRLNGHVPQSVKELLGDDLEKFEQVTECADKGDWGGYTRLMGGVDVKRKEQFLRICYFIKEECGKYSQPLKKLVGVVVSQVSTVLTRLRTWVVKSIRKPSTIVCQKVAKIDGNETIESSAPWSSVNNCTIW